MNCLTALEKLESVRPGSEDITEPELLDATLHLAECEACRAVHREREQFDRHIGRLMQEVPLPSGLRDRILSVLDERASHALQMATPRTAGEEPSDDSPLAARATGAVEVASVTTIREESTAERGETLFLPSQRKDEVFQPSRRRWMAVLTGTLVALVVIAGLMFLWSPRSATSPRLTLSDIREQVHLQWDRLEEFDGNFPVSEPPGVWQYSRRIRIGSGVKGDLKGDDGRHRVALYQFTVQDKQGREFQGLLVVVPAAALADPPPETFDIREERPENYARRDYGEFHTFAWTDRSRGLVYICFVPAGEGHRKALEAVLSPETA